MSTFIAIALVDRIGRKPLLFTGMSIMVVTLFFLGFLFEFISSSYPRISGILSVTLLFIYITGFEMGIGSLFWPLLTETFPAEYKDCGASLLNVIQWSLNILLAASFPSLVKILSQGAVFWLFALVGLLCILLLSISGSRFSQSTLVNQLLTSNKLGFKEARNESNYMYRF